MAAPVAAAAAPEGFSNGFGNAPPMMGTNPGLSLGSFLSKSTLPAVFFESANIFCLFFCSMLAMLT